MLDELLKVVKVDISDGTQSVKDYKDAVDDATEAAIDLDEALNEIAGTANTNLDNALKESVDHLDTLKKGTKDLKDEIGSEKGGIMSGITAGFSEAVDATLDEVGQLDGSIGKLGFHFRDYGKVIKSFFTSATNGLKGFKLALASTGIGLLIVAATTLYARFDDIKKALGITGDTFTKFKNTAIKALQTVVGAVVGLGSAIGYGVAEGVKIAMRSINQLKTVALTTFMGISQAATGNITGAIKYLSLAGAQAVNTVKGNAKEVGNAISEGWRSGFAAGENLVSDLLTSKTEENIAKAGSIAKAGAEQINNDILDQELASIQKRNDFAKKMIEISLLDENEKAKKTFEIEQKNYDERIAAYDKYLANFNGKSEEKVKLEQARQDLITDKYVSDIEYTNELQKKRDEEQKAAAEQKLKDQEAAFNKRLEDINSERDYKTQMAELTIEDEQALEDRLYEIKLNSLYKEQALYQQQIASFSGSVEEREKLERKYATVTAKINKTITDNQKKDETQRRAIREQQMQSSLSTASQLFGNLSKLAKENSKAGKALAIAQTTIDTFQSAQSSYKAMSGIPIVGPALGIAAAAAAIAGGVANIRSIMKTDEAGESSTPSETNNNTAVTATPEQIMPNVGVVPMLDEMRDLQQMQSIPVTNESQQRVYVVESDIQEVGTRVQVRESEATF